MAFNFSPKIVTDGLVLHLDAANPKSYTSGSTVWNDLSRGRNNGTLTNGPTFTSTNGGSIVFDGVDDYAQTTTNPIANNSSFSIGCWFNINTLNSTFRTLIDAGNLGTGTLGYCLAINSTNKLYVAVDLGFTAISNNININTWYYVVGTALAGTPYNLSLYLNGIVGTFDSSNNTNTLTNNSTFVRISQNINSTLRRFPGNMSQIQIYNRALTATEVLQNYNATKGRYGL